MRTLEVTGHRAVGRDAKANPAFGMSLDRRIDVCGVDRPVKLIIGRRSYAQEGDLC